MATRKRTDLRSRDVPEKKKLKGKPPFGFRFSSFFEGSYSRRSAAVCPFPTADHPPAPECFSPELVDDLSALPSSISPHASVSVESLFQLPFCQCNCSNHRDTLCHAHNSPNCPHAVISLSENTSQNNYRNRKHYNPADIPELSAAAMRVFPGLLIFHGHRRPVSIYPVNLLRRLFLKSFSNKNHRKRNQKIHHQHKNPKSHRTLLFPAKIIAQKCCHLHICRYGMASSVNNKASPAPLPDSNPSDNVHTGFWQALSPSACPACPYR